MYMYYNPMGDPRTSDEYQYKNFELKSGMSL